MNAHAEIDISADARDVWTVLADIASWPTWNPAVREAVFDSDIEVGARFRFSTVFGSMRCRLTVVDAPRALAWKGRLLTMGQQQTWRLEPHPGGTYVRTTAEMTGLGAHLFKGRLTERLQGELDALLQLLKLEAEVRTTEEREDAARQAARARRQDGDE